MYFVGNDEIKLWYMSHQSLVCYVLDNDYLVK